MYASCKFWQSKHCLNFLLLSDVILNKCGRAGAALTSVSIITTFPTVNQHRWLVTTNNWYRCLPPVLSICPPLSFTPTQMWKNSLSQLFMLCSVSIDVPTSTTILPPEVEGVLMGLQDHHIASPKRMRNVWDKCFYFLIFLSRNDPLCVLFLPFSINTKDCVETLLLTQS